MHITVPLIAIYAGLALSLPQFNSLGTIGSRNQVDGQVVPTIEDEQSQIYTPQRQQNSPRRTTGELLTESGNDLYGAVQQWNSDSPSNKNKPFPRPSFNTVQQPNDFTPPPLGNVPGARKNKPSSRPPFDVVQQPNDVTQPPLGNVPSARKNRPFPRPSLNTVPQPNDVTPPPLGNVPGTRKNKPSKPSFDTVQQPNDLTPPTPGNDPEDGVDYSNNQQNLINNGRNLQNGRDHSRRNGDTFKGTIYRNQQNSGQQRPRIDMEDPNTGRDSGSATNRPNQQTDEIQSSEDRKPIDIPVEPVPETGSMQRSPNIPTRPEQNLEDTRQIQEKDSPIDTTIDPSRQRGSRNQRSKNPKNPSKTYKDYDEMYNDSALDRCPICQSVRNKVDRDCYAKVGSSELLTSKFCDTELQSALSSCAESCPGSKVAKDSSDPRS